MANATSTDLQELYVAYFGRAADPTGLDYWTAKGITTTKFAADMYAQAEFKDAYGSLTVEAQVNQIYKNLFDRAADVTGLTYWTQEINLGNLQLAEIATHLIYAAKNNAGSEDDKTALTNRTNAAVAYTAKVKETTAGILAYSPISSDPWDAGANITEAVSYLSGIDKDTASTAAGIATSVATITSNGVQTAVTAGKAYTLTTGIDAVTASAGNDSINGSATTLTTGDTIDGGDGTDTLSVAVNLGAATSIAGFTTTNVENLAINHSEGHASAHTFTVNALKSTASKVTVSGSSTTTAEDTVTINNLAAGTTIAMSDATDLDVNANYVTAATSGTADSVSIALSGVSSTADNDTTLKVSAGFETYNISSTGSASTLDGLTGATASATTWNVTGDANLTLRAAQAVDATLDVIDASAFTGALSLATSNDTSSQDATILSVDQLDLTITGGSGNDTFVTANAADNEISIDGGAGNDSVTIVALPANASSTSVGDTLKGGAGTDTLISDIDLVDAAAVTVTTKVTGVSGFEILELNGFQATADVINPAYISTDITTVNIAAALAANLTVNATDSFAINLTGADLLDDYTLIADSGTGTADALTITNSNLATGTNQIGANDANITTTDFETVSIDTGSYSSPTPQLMLAVDIGTANALTLSGSNGLTTTSSTGVITAKTIDASAMTGGLIMGVAAATGVTTITGGSGNDTLRGDAASTISGGAGNDIIVGGTGNDTLSGGAGADTITVNTGTDAVTGGAGNDTFTVVGNLSSLDTFDGGEGTDTISLNNASLTTVAALSISDANIFNAGFNNVEKLVLSDALDQTSFDKGHLDSITYVKLESTWTGAETIAGWNSGDTLELTVAETETLTLTMNGATTGTTDVLNVVLSETGSSINYGDLSIANVETINVDSSESTASSTVYAGTLGLTLSQVSGGSAQTVNFTGNESLTVDTTIKAGTIDASGLTTVQATDAGLTMTGAAHTVAQTITGSAKVDSIIGSTKADTISLGAGADTITSSTGGDTIDGGTGTDTYVTASAETGADVEGAGTGTSAGIAINLGTTDIAGGTVYTQTGNYLSNTASLGAGTSRYVFAADNSFNSSVSNTLTSIENVDVSSAAVHYVKGGTGATTISVGVAASVTSADFFDGGDVTGTSNTDTINVTSDNNGTGAVFEDLTGIENITVAAGSTITHDVKLTINYTAADTAAKTIDLTARTSSSAASTIVLSDAENDGYYTVNGGAGVDTVTTGDGGALLTLGGGNDVITGDAAGVETYVFGATGAANGTDKIAANFTVSSVVDVLNFAALGFTSGAFNTTMVATAANGDVAIANKVVMYDSGVTDAETAENSRSDVADTITEIAALVQGANNAFALASGSKGIIITGDDAGATMDAIVWLVDDTAGGIAGTIEIDDITEITSIVDFDLNTLVAGNFVFA